MEAGASCESVEVKIFETAARMDERPNLCWKRLLSGRDERELKVSRFGEKWEEEESEEKDREEEDFWEAESLSLR